MQIHHPSARKNTSAFGLVITVVFLAIAMFALAGVLSWSTDSARQAERNNLYNMAQGAAEAADERVVAQMSRDFFQQSYNSTASYATNLPSMNGWPVTFSFGNGSGVANQTGVSFGNGGNGSDWPSNVWQALGGQYKGLNAYVIPATIISTATTSNQPYNVSATIKETVQFDAIPLFQFAIFYNMGLEINPGGNMVINGKVVANGPIWVDPPSSLTFRDTVSTTSNTVTYTRNPDDPTSPTPNPNVFYLNQDGTVNSNGPVTSATSLTMPVGTNADGTSAILQLPPAGTNPNSQNGQQYLYNQADLIISNSASGNLTAYFQDSNNAVRLTPIPYNVGTVVAQTVTNGFTTTYSTNITSQTSGHGRNQTTTYTTNVTSTTTPITSTTYTTNLTTYSFVTNVSFYDYRESKTVQAVQLDVGALTNWLNNPSTTGGSTFNNEDDYDNGHSIDSVYLYNNAPSDSSDLPAVRVADGATLPSSGLTVVTPQPLYVLGNYNLNNGSATPGNTDTTYTAPAALMGDAITILSTDWSDSYNANTSLNSRNAGNTTINAATYEGIVQSTIANGTKHYSGGAENFLRLLENWSGDTLTYNGAIVVMFQSQYATNFWQNTGAYYQVPTRDWGFDQNFLNQKKLPPLTPTVKAMQRLQWTAN
jgi:hypothetical protein